jgi:hypothetical protein
MSDLVAYHPSDGTVWTGYNTGSSFRFARTGRLVPSAGWSIMAGEFAGNSVFDVAAYHPSDGTVWVAASPSGTGPDLMVRRFEVTGIATVNTDGSYTLPVRVIVRNQGNALAGPTHTWVSLLGSAAPQLLGLRVFGQTDRYNTPSLAPQAEITLNGIVIVPATLPAEWWLVAVADACRGTTLPNCLINETNEDNVSDPVRSFEIPYSR